MKSSVTQFDKTDHFTCNLKNELLVPACRADFEEQFDTKLEASLATIAGLLALYYSHVMHGFCLLFTASYSASKADAE